MCIRTYKVNMFVECNMLLKINGLVSRKKSCLTKNIYSHTGFKKMTFKMLNKDYLFLKCKQGLLGN